MEITSDLSHCIQRIRYSMQENIHRNTLKHTDISSTYGQSYREARKAKMALSLGYHGNIVDLW